MTRARWMALVALVWLAVVAARGGMGMEDMTVKDPAAEEPRKLVDNIPSEVREYLSAGDGLGQASVIEAHPDVQKTLKKPETRAAIVAYLGSQEPWHDRPDLAISSLAVLQDGANEKEAAILRPLMQHPNEWVRVRACEYMMAIYYPAKNRPAMMNLFQRMLADPDEVVRVQAARWIKGLNMVEPMRSVLEAWTHSAIERKWNGEESFAIIQGVLRQK